MAIFARNNSAQCGLTLVELLIVLTIMAATVGMVGAAYKNASPTLALKATSAQLLSDLKAARLHARKTGDTVAVTPNVDGYNIIELDIERRFHKKIKTQWVTDSDQLVFSSRFANLGGAITLELENRKAIIRIHPITGLIEQIE